VGARRGGKINTTTYYIKIDIKEGERKRNTASTCLDRGGEGREIYLGGKRKWNLSLTLIRKKKRREYHKREANLRKREKGGKERDPDQRHLFLPMRGEGA